MQQRVWWAILGVAVVSGVTAGRSGAAEPVAAGRFDKAVAAFAAADLKTPPPRDAILFVSIKPSPSRWARWPEMSKANQLIREYAAAHDGLGYIDTTGTLLGAGGTPDESLFLADRLHMNRQGYERWIPVLRPVVEKALRDAH